MFNMRATAVIGVVVILASMQVFRSSASTIEVIRSKSTILSKPNCCYKCAGCYDKDNQQRYDALTAVVKAAASSRKAICTPASKCPIVNGVTKVASNKAVTLKPYQQLTFSGAGARSYTGASIAFQRYTALSVVGTGLDYNFGQILFNSPNTWFTAANGSVALSKSALQGSLRLFSTAYVSFNQSKSSVLLTNTVVDLDYTRLTLSLSTFSVSWTTPSAPAGPPYKGIYPFIATYSYIDLGASELIFQNVTDAYFLYSTLRAQSSQVVLVNSNVRFLDSVVDLTDTSFKLTNSTLVLNKVVFKADQYISFVKGSFTGLPKPTLPFTSINKYTFKATSKAGSIGLKGTPK